MPTLVTIAPGHRLAPAPAASWARAVAAGCPVTITSSYRDPARQAELRRLYLAGNWPNYVAPVDRSDHPRGYALDLKPPAELWMREHPEFGWVFNDPTERWHCVYRISTDRTLSQPTPPTALEPEPTQEDDMKPWFFRRKDGAIIIVTPTGARVCTADQWATYVNLGQATFPPGMDAMDPHPFDLIVASLGGLR